MLMMVQRIIPLKEVSTFLTEDHNRPSKAKNRPSKGKNRPNRAAIAQVGWRTAQARTDLPQPTRNPRTCMGFFFVGNVNGSNKTDILTWA